MRSPSGAMLCSRPGTPTSPRVALGSSPSVLWRQQAAAAQQQQQQLSSEYQSYAFGECVGRHAPMAALRAAVTVPRTCTRRAAGRAMRSPSPPVAPCPAFAASVFGPDDGDAAVYEGSGCQDVVAGVLGGCNGARHLPPACMSLW
jgi:hypothetical protein